MSDYCFIIFEPFCILWYELLLKVKFCNFWVDSGTEVHNHITDRKLLFGFTLPSMKISPNTKIWWGAYPMQTFHDIYVYCMWRSRMESGEFPVFLLREILHSSFKKSYFIAEITLVNESISDWNCLLKRSFIEIYNSFEIRITYKCIYLNLKVH